MMYSDKLNYMNVPRRDVLKATGAAGAFSLFGVGAIGTASAQEFTEFTGWKLTADNPTSGDWKIGRPKGEYQFPVDCPHNEGDTLSSYTEVFLFREDEDDDFVEMFLPTTLVDGNWESLSFSQTGCTLNIDGTDLTAPDSLLIQVSGTLVSGSEPEEPVPEEPDPNTEAPGKSGEAPGQNRVEICVNGETLEVPEQTAKQHIARGRATEGACNGN